MIGIIGFCDIHFMQYLNKYTVIFDENNIDYEVVYWNRSGVNDQVPFRGQSFAFSYSMNTYKSFYKKIGGFFRYSLYLRSVIKKKKYDRLIILTTQTAISLFDILVHKYKGRYIFDYRDITKEKNIPLFKNLVRILFRKAQIVMISSKGFLRELGIINGCNYVIAHNTQRACHHTKYIARKNIELPIRVVYWGIIRQIDYQKNICDFFGNDRRFSLIFHGDGFYRELQEYCDKNGYNNICFTGRYTPDEIPLFANSTDILNCIYENDANTQPTLAVKFYDAIHYRIPLVVNKYSYLAEYTSNVSGIIAVDILQTEEIDKLYKWYQSLIVDSIDFDYGQFENIIFKEDMLFQDALLKFVT